MQNLICAIIRFYQYFIRPLKKPCCRFEPSCSEYALLAVKQFGPFRGSWLAFCRLLRCQPLSRGGYDPILSKKEKM